MKRPDDKEPEAAGGRAAERLREFLRQRLPPEASAEEVQAEAERLTKEETERSQNQTKPEMEPPPPQQPDPGNANPE